MVAVTFSWPCWTLALVVVFAGTAPEFAELPIFTRCTGMNVTLKFSVPNGTTSVWLLRPNSTFVFYCRDGHPTHPSDQEESFKGRVEGMDCDNINSAVSVTLSNLTLNDSGPYEFHWVERDRRRFNKPIFLNVTDSGQSGACTDGSVGLTVGLFVGLTVLGLLLFAFGGTKFFMGRCSSRLPPAGRQLI